jgi:hypothetical protein
MMKRALLGQRPYSSPWMDVRSLQDPPSLLIALATPVPELRDASPAPLVIVCVLFG